MAINEPLMVSALGSINNINARADLERECNRLGALAQRNIALGVWMLRRKADINHPLVAARHAVLLMHRFLGFKRAPSYPEMRGVISSWDNVDCQAEIEAVHSAWKQRQEELQKIQDGQYLGGVVLGSSFLRYANQEEKQVGREAIRTCQTMLTRALLSVKVADRDADAGPKYTTYFGVPNPNRHATVKENIQKLHKALGTKPVALYYRGEKVRGIDNSPDPTGRVSPATGIAETWSRGAQARGINLHVYQNDRACAPFSHIWLCKGAFEKNAVTHRKRQVTGSMSIAGTILHELSHYHCNTNDRGPFATEHYGDGNCQPLAGNNPDYAVNNADSYRYYLEQFQWERPARPQMPVGTDTIAQRKARLQARGIRV
jgi:hypothetical protein